MGTDLLLIITSTAAEFSRGTNINDLAQPCTPKMKGFRLRHILKSELHQNHWR